MSFCLHEIMKSMLGEPLGIREVELKAKERGIKFNEFVRKRKSWLNHLMIMDDYWDEQDYLKAFEAKERGEKKYKGFDLTRIHIE